MDKTARRAAVKNATARKKTQGKLLRWESMDDYIAAQPAKVQGALKRVRSTIRKVLRSFPGDEARARPEEVISYQIPAFKLHGRIVIYFAAWREHYSLYPASDGMQAAIPELAPYRASKGTVRFPLSGPVPVKLIADIAKFRAKEVTEQARRRRKK